jgi:hypothetical protein
MTDTDPFTDADRAVQTEDDDPEQFAGDEVDYDFDADPDKEEV